MYNIFVIGPSNSGKTSIANIVSQALVMPVISSSDWVRQAFIGSVLDKQQLIEAMTSFSLEKLRQDPEVCIRHIRKKYPKVEAEKGFILEGFRNPKDFLTLLNPRTDIVIRLKYTENPYYGMNFEQEGLSVIDYSINWLLNNRLMQSEQLMEFEYKSLDAITDIANSITNRAGIWIQEMPL